MMKMVGYKVFEPTARKLANELNKLARFPKNDQYGHTYKAIPASSFIDTRVVLWGVLRK